MNSENRRQFSRIPMDCEATLSCGGEQWHSKLLDISLKGALLQSLDSHCVIADPRCRLSIALDGDIATIVMEGTVIHHHDDLIGMRCDSIDLESITHLKRIVELNLGDEALLERELSELIKS